MESYVISSVSKQVTIDFCYLCENSPHYTTNNSRNINPTSFEGEVFDQTCYPKGIYDWFAMEISPSLTYVSFVSILPPVNANDCKIEIMDNNEFLEDTLILRKNGNWTSTNNIWSLKHTENKPLKYQIYRNKLMRGK